jgi:hypothetical protein
MHPSHVRHRKRHHDWIPRDTLDTAQAVPTSPPYIAASQSVLKDA